MSTNSYAFACILPQHYHRWNYCSRFGVLFFSEYVSPPILFLYLFQTFHCCSPILQLHQQRSQLLLLNIIIIVVTRVVNVFHRICSGMILLDSCSFSKCVSPPSLFTFSELFIVVVRFCSSISSVHNSYYCCVNNNIIVIICVSPSCIVSEAE